MSNGYGNQIYVVIFVSSLKTIISISIIFYVHHGLFIIMFTLKTLKL